MVVRIACVVPGCRRKRGQRKGEPPITEHTEFICRDHWALVPRSLKLLRRRLRRRHGDRPRGWVADRRIWGRMRRHAIERAAGL